MDIDFISKEEAKNLAIEFPKLEQLDMEQFKCSTLYVQRSGKSVELRLSVPGSWAVIVVEL